MESFQKNTNISLGFLDKNRMFNHCFINDILTCNYSESNNANYL